MSKPSPVFNRMHQGAFAEATVRGRPPLLSPRQNLLLAALPRDEYERLLAYLVRVPLPLDLVLHDSGEREKFVYFPTEGRVSRVHIMADGSQAEFAVTGCEGAIGISSFLGGGSTPSLAIVSGAGYAYRMEASRLHDLFEQGGALAHILLRYTQALMTQITQTAVCNRHHTVDQQLCRWLLSSLDRSPGAELAVTQQAIAEKLGVRRESVTDAARHLQEAGLIKLRRGSLAVLDRSGIERRVCECYAVVKREYDRLLFEKRSQSPLPQPVAAPAGPGSGRVPRRVAACALGD